MVIVVTAVGVRKVVEKWLCENMTCELVVSRNARHECCVEVIYDSGNPSVLRTLLQAAVGLFVQRVTAACLLIALDKYLVRCVEEKHLYFKSRFSEIIKAAVQLIEKLTATDIGNYSHLAHMSVGFYADIRKFRYKLGRDIIYAVVADILKSVHRTRFA